MLYRKNLVSAIVQLVISSFLCKKLVVGATLDDMSLLQDHDAVAVAYCGKTMGNDKSSSAFHQLVHTILNQLLGTGINGAGSLIQY